MFQSDSNKDRSAALMAVMAVMAVMVVIVVPGRLS